MEICEKIIRNEVEFTKNIDLVSKDFIRKLLNVDPLSRLGTKNSKNIDIWTHRFLRLD